MMLDRNSLVGFTPESVMVNPRKSTSFSANLIFSGKQMNDEKTVADYKYKEDPSMSVLSPSEQVGKQFEERVSCIEEQVHQFLNSGLKMTRIKKRDWKKLSDM